MSEANSNTRAHDRAHAPDRSEENVQHPTSNVQSRIRQRTPRIEDVSAPFVGAYYLVPTAYNNRWRVRVPIYGPLHEDRDFIGFQEEHWHIDWRFVTHGFYNDRLWTRKEGAASFLHGIVTSRNMVGDDALETRRLRMKRETPPYPPADKVPWLGELEAAFKGRVLPLCRTCPHRGISLRNLEPDKDGVVLCTGHGLAWNVKTGALVRRLPITDHRSLITGNGDASHSEAATGGEAS